MEYRTERDSMGEVKVPGDALWGAGTQRAMENFPISGLRFPREFIRALGIVKWAASIVNRELGLLDSTRAGAIQKACEEVIAGELDDQFPLDIFQTGSGTSTNMNANEVIANRANRILSDQSTPGHGVHPNDHVNMSQSSNDVIPTAIHISALEEIEKRLIPALDSLHGTLDQKWRDFDSIVKLGRTHLMDATPIRLGQEFSGYGTIVSHGLRRLEHSKRFLLELAIGGTAVGTGLNTHPEFKRRMVEKINEFTGISFREAESSFEAQSSRDAAVETSSILKTIAVGLTKIANDIRWLGSGPRGGIGELLLPPLQPGSSMMPGKVNPVIAESVCQVCAQVIGNDAAITVGGLSGNFELNVMMPVIAHNLLQSITLLANAVSLFDEKCVRGLKPNRKRCEELVERSLALSAALSPIIGYERAAKIAQEAYHTGKTIRQVCLEQKILSEERLDEVLEPSRLTEPNLE